MAHRTWIELDASALLSNLQTIQGLLQPGTRLCAVVKANAYGHGLMETSELLRRHGVDAFAVDTASDALKLKEAFPTALVLVLGYLLTEDLKAVMQAGIHFTVAYRDRIREAQAIAQELKVKAYVHLKIETGTMRQGIEAIDLPDVLEAVKASPEVEVAGLSTHFASMEDTRDAAFAAYQYDRFTEAKHALKERGITPTWIHTACSAGIILYPSVHDTMVRAGISLYGIWSSKDVEMAVLHHRIRCALQPVLSFKTRVAQVKTARVGTPIGYGGTETMPRNGRIAVLPVGYFDGYDRALSSRGEVLIKGHRCKVMGRVCMNMMMVDVSNVPTLFPGDEAVLIGRSGAHSVTVYELARTIGTIPYECLARLNPLLPRTVKEREHSSE